MENNTINVNVATGEVTHSYTEVVEDNTPIVINYEAEVHRLIRQKYSQSEEFAILRQKDEKPSEWQEYYDYCEACKEKVREML